MLSDQCSIFVDRFDLEQIQIIEHKQVSNEARCNCSKIIQVEILRGIIGSETYSFDRIQSQFDSATYHRVNVPACGQILRVAVIGDKEDTRRVHFFDQWK